jgi:hypothetical protein
MEVARDVVNPTGSPITECRQILVLNFLTQVLDGEQLAHAQEQNQAKPPLEEQNDPQPTTQLMNISLQAVGQSRTAHTPTVIITYYGKQVVTLIDSGSSNSFMDLQFALECNCLLQSADLREVKVTGGGILISDSIALECTFTIAKHQFQKTFRVLNLPDHEVILGCNWLEHHSPFTIDFQQSTLQIQKEGKE